MRRLVGPCEQSYDDLRVDLIAARDAAKSAEQAAGELRGELTEAYAALDRALLGGPALGYVLRQVKNSLGGTFVGRTYRARRRGPVFGRGRRPLSRMATAAGPRFSVLTPIHDPERAHLRTCLDSVRAQTFESWEHVVVDDGSTAAWVATMLAEAAAADPRVRVLHRPRGGGVAAHRDALAASSGELITVLDATDALEPDALAAMDAVFTAGDVDVAYADHDIVDADGAYVVPSFKPAFSPERLRAHNYIDRPVVTRRTVADAAGGFRDGYDGAHDYDFVLRVTEQARRVAHVPRILCHTHRPPVGAAADGDSAVTATAAARVVADHCARGRHRRGRRADP